MTLDDWTGGVGDTWADEWRRTDRSFARLDPALDAAILAAGGVRALDIGCGAGRTSLAFLAASGDAVATGIDLSPALVAVAADRARAAGLADRGTFRVGDASRPSGDGTAPDLLFSRHGVMFFPDPVDAFGRMRRFAAPEARLVFSCFAAVARNPWARIVGDVDPGIRPGPFAFADPARVEGMLRAAGWRPTPPRLVEFGYVAGEGPDEAEATDDALGFFRRIGPAARALRDAAADRRSDLLERVRRACASRFADGAVAFPAAAWLWTACKEPS